MLGIKQERLVPWFKVTLQKRKEVLKVLKVMQAKAGKSYLKGEYNCPNEDDQQYLVII